MSYAPRLDHPPEHDLVNFARDQLGEQKKARILQHCRQCHDCADRLIELTREHAPPAGPLKLTKWNKIWLWLLLFSLVAATAGVVWTFRQMARQPAMLPGLEAPMPEPEPPAEDGDSN
jgi:hypothetical protein